MSEEKVEIVRAAIDAANRADLDAALEYTAPGYELDNSRALSPDQRGVFRGDRAREVAREFFGAWERFRIEPHEFIEAGEHVVVPWTFHGGGREGIEIEARTTWTFTIRDGTIERMCMHQEREEALEAAGLSE